MKYIYIILSSFMLGYLSYPMFHPPKVQVSEELLDLFGKFFAKEALMFAESKNAEEKLKAADAMYEKMMILFLSQLSIRGPENRPLVSSAEKIRPKDGTILIMHNSESKVIEASEPKNLTIAEKIIRNRLDRKSILMFADFSPIDSQDSRVKKITGSFSGKFKLQESSRTGNDETITMDIDEKIVIRIIDSYDNTTLSYSAVTHHSFKSVPGDENLLLLNLPEHSYLFIDMRSYPDISGKIYKGHLLFGELSMKRKSR